MRHTISVLVENKFGVLTRVAGLFSGRGYNIDTLNVAPTADPTASRMTIVTRGDDATLEQIVKQLNKLADVLKVQDFREGEYVDRELVLVKVAVDFKTRAEVMQITDIFRAKSVDVEAKGRGLPRRRVGGPGTGVGKGRRGFQDSRRSDANHGYFPRENRGCATQEPDHRSDGRRQQSREVPQPDEDLWHDRPHAHWPGGHGKKPVAL